MLVRKLAVSSGGIAWSPYAVVHPADEVIPCVTSSLNEALLPGASVTVCSGTAPAKSWVVLVALVGSGWPV